MLNVAPCGLSRSQTFKILNSTHVYIKGIRKHVNKTENQITPVPRLLLAHDSVDLHTAFATAA